VFCLEEGELEGGYWRRSRRVSRRPERKGRRRRKSRGID
jgi:hypothetical protein